MPGRNEQRKPGTARGLPRRSRTAKASRISRRAVKSRCTRERDGWGRLSVDGPGQNNLDPSEGPWGGGYPTHHGGALSSRRLGAVRENRRSRDARRVEANQMFDGGMPGAGLSPSHAGKAPPERPAFQPYWGKPTVRNVRGDRGDVSIIRSLVRGAATLAAGPAGESPAGGNCPVATVVIPDNGEGDRSVESSGVKASGREASNSAGRNDGEPVSPEIG
jgi:hypothetical protein